MDDLPVNDDEYGIDAAVPTTPYDALFDLIVRSVIVLEDLFCTEQFKEVSLCKIWFSLSLLMSSRSWLRII